MNTIMQFSGMLLKSSLRQTRPCIERSFRSAVIHQKRVKEQWTTRKEKFEVPENEWRSFFHYFTPEKGIGIDILHRLQKPIDISPKGIKNWYRRYKSTQTTVDQTFIQERVSILGCDLAAAHFIVFREGKVRKKGSEEWIVMNEENDEYDLPTHYAPGFFVECIDASGTELIYEGLECMNNLDYLKWVSLANCPNIDDWCIDRICGQYGSTLEYLNLSNCTAVTGRGIAALVRLRNLKTLDLTGLHGIQDIELLCLLIEDILPDIKIIGINYMDPKILSGQSV